VFYRGARTLGGASLVLQSLAKIVIRIMQCLIGVAIHTVTLGVVGVVGVFVAKIVGITSGGPKVPKSIRKPLYALVHS